MSNTPEHNPVQEPQDTPNPELGESVVDPTDYYEVLEGYTRATGEKLTGDEIRQWYVHLTDDLISKMEGSRELYPKPDVVIFLDKSARPVSWMVKELWPSFAREPGTKFEEGKVPPMPEIKYLNIDREQWQPIIGDKQRGDMDMSRLPKDAIDDLRAIFAQKLLAEDESSEGVPTILDGKNVLIVDEVGVTGATLEIAEGLLSRAFPEAEFSVTHWMSPKILTLKNGHKINLDVPVWYDQRTSHGRGVGDRDNLKSSHSPSRTQRRGAYFLSAALREKRVDLAAREATTLPLSEQDPKSLRLREEIHKLGEDVRNHELIVFPAERDGEDSWEDFQARVAAFNDQSYNEVMRERFKPL